MYLNCYLNVRVYKRLFFLKDCINFFSFKKLWFFGNGSILNYIIYIVFYIFILYYLLNVFDRLYLL